MGVKNEDKNKKSPLDKDPPGVIKRLFYWWMFPVFYKGNKRDLEEPDLVRAKHMYDSKRVGDLLERNWLKEEAAAKLKGTKPSIIRVLTKTFALQYMPGGINLFLYTAIRNWLREELSAKAKGKSPSITGVLIKTFAWDFLPGGLMQLTCISLRTGMPLLFAQLLSFWSIDSTMTRETASMYAGAMIIAGWCAAFSIHQGNLYCQQFGMKLRVATSTLMFRKVLRMNNGALGETTAGKLVNILSNDLQRFDLALMFMHYLWIIPLQIIAVGYLGYMQAGYAALIGLATMIVISLPIITLLSKMIQKVRFRTAQKTDDRVKVMSEVISGIQVIKMYAWEIPFQKVVSEKRNDEMKEIRKSTLYRTIFIGFLLFTEKTALFVTILSLILSGNPLSATVVYPLQQFLTVSQINITLMLPLVMSFTAELLVSLGRVQDFLMLEDRLDLVAEVTPKGSNLFRNVSEGDDGLKSDDVRPLSFHYKSELNVSQNGSVPDRQLRRSVSPQPEFAIDIRDLSASWSNDTEALALRNINMRIRSGKLCAIIGAVGSGKSSILQVLLKELPSASGTVSVYGKISYASQEAWLFPSTVRENILFGLPYDPEKYKRVSSVCALEKDFKQFPYGDQTLVGERGVSLSGGQRARINLARAVYRESDIYLLDDPLSAVDANVGRRLFEDCINGYLRGKTRVLVTHQIHFLKAADLIIVLNEGRIENIGSFDELLSSGKDFAKLFTSLQDDKEKDVETPGSKRRQSTLRSLSIASEVDEDSKEFEAQKIADEEKQSGNIKLEVVTSYFRAGGSVCFLLFTLLTIFLATAASASTDYWISYWANQMAVYEEQLDGAPIDPGLDVQVGNFTTAQYLIIYGSLVLSCILLTNFRVIPFVHVCVSASKNLHNRMFSVLIRGIMRFFDTSSSGRILNRFTKDMGALDEILPRTLLDVVQIYGNLAGILVLNALALYWTLIPSFVLLITFGYFVKIYLKTAQGIKRLEGVTKSPVFGMVTSSLNGIATIRSAGAQQRLIDEFDKHQDLHTTAWNSYLAGGCMFGFYLDTMCLMYLTTVIFVFLYLDFGSLISVGSVGLAVTQSNTLTAMLQHGARMLVEFIAQLTSVERVLEYTKIETEENLFEGKVPTLTTWPSEGKVEFKDVFLRYGPDEAPVLKKISFCIESGWKVGIVGRTGAGKSSLISALFRFAYIDGSITIDGVETSVVARQELRSKISIIPQEPMLFSATIRYNLDPFDIYSDEDIWRALEQVDLKAAVPSLDFKVTEGGNNFSVGQRQLMCLARAVLRSNKVLIMDEATANVDPQTDNFIQQTVRRQFASCTVLTIAHRLNTIMDSDRVLVMGAGEVLEFDHPYNLLSDPSSHLSSMVNETGDKNSSKLYQIAKDSFFHKNSTDAAR